LNKPQTTSETVVQGSADDGILTSADDVFRVDEGMGRLFVQTLLPANQTLRKIGGADYRYWSDGANRTGGASGYETSYAEPGLWRVEVVPGTAQTDDVFLHAFYITTTSASAMPTVSRITTTGNEMEGAHVLESGRERVALFSAAMNGAPVSTGVQYDVTTSGVCVHLLTGVLSDTVYRIAVGASQQTLTSTAEHTLYFTTTSSGALHVAVSPLGAPPQAVTDLRVTDAIMAANMLTATLRWTAPLNAITTTLRYSRTLIAEANWASATLLTGTLSGSAALYTSNVPYNSGTIYWAHKSQNVEGDWSALSNNTFWPRFEVYLPLVRK